MMLFDMSHLLQGMMSIAHPLQPPKKENQPTRSISLDKRVSGGLQQRKL